jgi:hypothetical protein
MATSGNADTPGELEFTDANGHPIRAGPTITPPNGRPPPWTRRSRHPTGERLHTTAIAVNPPSAPPPPRAA